MRKHFLRILALAVVCSLVSSDASAHEPHAFLVKRIYTGRDVIDNGVLVTDHSKVLAVGAQNLVEIPDDAVIHRLNDAVIIPGLVIAETTLGDTSRDSQRTVTPEVRAVDGFDFYADYSPLVSAGITTVQVSPGRSRLMPGMGGVVKLSGAGPADRILNSAESLRVILSAASRNAPRIYEPPTGAVSVENPLKPTRYQIGTTLSAAVAGLRAVLQTVGDGKTADEGAVFDFAALQEALQSKRLRVTANTAAEIRAALRLAKEFQLKVTLVDPANLDALLKNDRPEELDGLIFNVGVRAGTILNPSVPNPEVPRAKAPWEYAARLIQTGMSDSIAIRPAADSDLKDMLFLGGLFTRGGTSTAQALAMLTANPAKLLGVADRVGTLSEGMDADFVVMNADPFSPGAAVMSTWVNGASAYDRETANQTTLIKADKVYTGSDVLQNAAVVVGTQKIRGLGQHVSAPADAKVRSFPGGVIVPGYIDLSTQLGWGGTVSGASAATKLGDRLTSDDSRLQYAREGGVTTAILTTSGSVAPVMAFKLGRKPRVLKDPIGLKFAVSSNLTTGLPSLKRTLTTARSYHAAWVKYEADMVTYRAKLKEYEAAKAKYDAAKKAAEAKKKAEEAKKAAEAKKTSSGSASSSSAKPTGTEKSGTSTEKTAKGDDKKTDSSKPDEKSKTATTGSSAAKSTSAAKPTTDPDAPKKPTEPKKPRSSSTYEPYRALFAGKIPAFVEADTAIKIKAAVKLFREEFQLTTILVGGDELYRVPELLAKHSVRVAVGPTLIREVDNVTHNLPQILANHQIPFGFQSKATTGVRLLPWAVAYSVHRGLGTNDALHGLTGGAAKLLSLDDQVGSIAVGQDADLVVLSGPPFHLASEVLAVMIDGEWVYEKETDQ